MVRQRASCRVAAAAVLSPLLHAAAWAVLVAMPAISAVDPRPVAPSRHPATAMIIPLPPPEPEQPKPDKSPEDEAVRLGIEKSDSVTMTWLGFEDPTPHSARKSDVEQAALARDVPPPAAAEPKPNPAAGASTPVPAPAAPDAQKPQPPAAPRPSPDSPPGEAPEAAKPAPPDAGGDMPAGPEQAAGADDKPKADPAPVPPDPKADDKPVKPAEPKPAPKVDPRPAGPATPDSDPARPESAAPPGQEQARDAQKSEKESDATSLTEAIEVHPGRPAAAQGLDITTRRPIFTTYTQITSWPSNPSLKVTFNRQGKVSKAVWVRKSGYDSVDNPVLTAVYAWTAKGKAIRDLPAPTKESPDPGVTITVTILLR